MTYPDELLSEDVDINEGGGARVEVVAPEMVDKVVLFLLGSPWESPPEPELELPPLEMLSQNAESLSGLSVLFVVPLLLLD